MWIIKPNHHFVRITTYTYLTTEYITDTTKRSDMLNKNTYGVKRWGQSEAAVIWLYL